MSKEVYYIVRQGSGFVGNSLKWRSVIDGEFTVNIMFAKRFTETEVTALERVEISTEFYLLSDMLKIAQHHIPAKKLSRYKHTSNTGMYVLRDKRYDLGGHSAMWWASGQSGYTCDIRMAHFYENVEECQVRSTDKYYSLEKILKHVELHVDMQDLGKSRHFSHVFNHLKGDN